MQFECYICNDSVGEDNIGNECCALISCGHVYHKSCIDEWKKQPRGSTCPVCRQNYKKYLVLFGMGTADDTAKSPVNGNKAVLPTTINLQLEHMELRLKHAATIVDLRTETQRCEYLEKATVAAKHSLEEAMFKLSMYEELFGQECTKHLEKIITDAQNN